jgi:hypothetical protein
MFGTLRCTRITQWFPAGIDNRADERFILEEPFRLHRVGQTDIVVKRGDVTDLASVPAFLTWLVPRYGRHTLPALLHDQLVEPGMDPDEREGADTILRDTMGGPACRSFDDG